MIATLFVFKSWRAQQTSWPLRPVSVVFESGNPRHNIIASFDGSVFQEAQQASPSLRPMSAESVNPATIGNIAFNSTLPSCNALQTVGDIGEVI